MTAKNPFSSFVYKLYSFNLPYRKFVCWWKNDVLKKSQYHIGLRKGEGSANVVMVETPAQVRQIAEYFGNFEVLADHREYLSILIKTPQSEFLVISTGIGTPPIAIGMEELAIIGVKQFLYIGSCKPLLSFFKEDELLIVKAAIKEDGTSREYLPMIIPAVGDVNLINKARSELMNKGNPFHLGISVTVDLDPYHIPDQIPLQVQHEQQIQTFKDGSAMAVDRAAAGVYAVATKIQKPACCILRACEAESELPFSLIESLPVILS
ncbi:MAG: nucleoside phosphorylase [Anaerolineaceae bacterium]